MRSRCTYITQYAQSLLRFLFFHMFKILYFHTPYPNICQDTGVLEKMGSPDNIDSNMRYDRSFVLKLSPLPVMDYNLLCSYIVVLSTSVFYILGSSHMTWKERKEMENRKVVSLGGKVSTFVFRNKKL